MDDEAIAEHFAAVETKRRGGTRGDPVPEGDMQVNELTADLKK